MLVKFFIFVALTGASLQLDMPCINVWESDYLIFIYREEEGGTKISGGSLLSKSSPGKVIFSCSEIDIPTSCNIPGKARLVYMDESGTDCTVLRQTTKIDYPRLPSPVGADGDYTVRMTLTGTPAVTGQTSESLETMTVNIEVSHSELAQNSFTRTSAGLEISIYSQSNPVHKLTFLQILKENPLISTVIFFTLGFLLCFFGLKFYRDMLMFFIPLMIAVLGFYLYLTIVEKSVETNHKFILVLVMFLCLGAVVALAVTFTNVIYFVLCELSSRPRRLPTRRHWPQAAGAFGALLRPAPH
jgi:hypothetical protein